MSTEENNLDLYKVDKDGYLINPTSKNLIKHPWTLLVEDCIHVCTNSLKENGQSIYIIGSVVTGKAVEGVSDLDLVVITYSQATETTIEDLTINVKLLRSKHPFARKISIDFFAYDTLDRTAFASSDLLYLKIAGASVYGQSILEELPKYKPDYALGKFLTMNYKKKLDRSIKAIEEGTNKDSLTKDYKYLAKYIIRAGSDLCIPAKKIFTTDLYTGFKIFTSCYPESSDDMYFFFNLLNKKSLPDKNIVLKKARTLGTELEKRIDAVFSV